MARKKRVTVKRRKARRNPISKAKAKARARKAARTRKANKLKRKASARKAAATKRRARRNPAAKKRKATRRKARRNPGTRKQVASARKARRARKVRGKHMRSAKTALRRGKKGSRVVARTYIRARSAAQRSKAGYLGAEAKKLAKVYGLTRINPSIKSVMKDLKAAVPLIFTSTATLLGAAAGGQFVGAKLHSMLPVGAPAVIKRNIVPISTGLFTVGLYTLLKMSKGMQKWAGPALIGGAAATGVHLLMYSQWGQMIAQKMGLPVTLANPMSTAEGAKAMAQGKPAAGIGSYMTVSQYLGDFVSAGPQEAFGGYVGSDFPIHTPGPGDNMSVHASLGAYEGDYDIPPGPSFYGRSDLGEYEDPALPVQDIDLAQTPGGTMITAAELSGGLFGGQSAIG